MTEKEIKSEITEKLNQGTSKSVLYDQFKDEIKDESLRKISLQTILWTKAEIQKNPFVLLYNNHKYLKEWEDLTAVFNATTEVRNWADYRNFLLGTLQPCGNIFHIQHINY